MRQASQAQRRTIWERDGRRCRYCRSFVTLRSLHADHKVPFGRGGLTEVDNLVTSCAKCNYAKRTSDYYWFSKMVQERGIAWRDSRALDSLIYLMANDPTQIPRVSGRSNPLIGWAYRERALRRKREAN